MLPAILFLLAGCAAGALPIATPTPSPAPTPTPPPSGPVTFEPAAPCDAPTAGFLRLRPGERGLAQDNPADTTERSCPWMPGGVVVSDLDGDGDHDLLFSAPPGFPALWEGVDGAFTARGVDVDLGPLLGRETLAQAAVDLDGDGLPEVLLVGEGFAASCPNLGGLRFGPPELLFVEPDFPRTCINSLAVGDVDGDGDLDLLLPGLDPIPHEGFRPSHEPIWPGTPDRLLVQDGGVFTLARALEQSPYPWLSMHALFTDRDDDGDLDLFVGSDRARDGRPGASFWRNDGGLVDDAAETGADVHACVMGGEGRDFDGDGDRDYCFSDLSSTLRCLLNEDGVYVDGGAALGLTADLAAVPGWTPSDEPWAPWSVEAIDLDNDGHLDVATAAGPPPGPAGVADTQFSFHQPDVLWQGTGEGFVDRSVEAGYARTEAHYGLASADLDRDGTRELILGSWGGPVVLWDNPCGPGAWLEVALEGPPGNRQGYGARVEVEAGARVEVQELHALRTLGQSAPELHFGLGEAEGVDRIEVRWTDGATTSATDLPVRGRATVRWGGDD